MPQRNNNKKTNIWDVIRDVLIASINKGQFPLALFSLIVVILVVKMDGDKATELIFRIFEELLSLRLLGWALSIILIAAWYRHARKLRRVFTEEVTRIANEKTALQQKLTNRVNQSSKR